MASGGWQFYLVSFAGSAALCLVLTPLALRVALRRGIFDEPASHKRHASPVPYLGGVAIVVAFSAVVVGAALVRPPTSGLGELVAVFGVALVLAATGLWDDLRNLPAVSRLGVQVAGGAAVWWLGAGVSIFGFAPADAAFTVLWVVGVTNAFNLLDNMDGLSAGVAAIGAGWLFVIAAVNGQFLVAGLAAALAGCALGFLRHNFHPARIYMGDAGSLFLGFLLAYLGLKLRFAGPTSVTFLVPILVVGVALFDTALVTVSRIAHGRSPLRGGLDHTSHRLVQVGVGVPAAVSLIYAAAFASGMLGLVVSRIDRFSAYLLVGLVVGLGLLLGGLLLRVRVYAPDDESLEAVVAAEARRVVASLEPPWPGAEHREPCEHIERREDSEGVAHERDPVPDTVAAAGNVPGAWPGTPTTPRSARSNGTGG